MTAPPRVAVMARPVLLMVFALLLAACSASDPDGGDPPAEEATAEDVKSEVDDVARTVLPPLVDEVGGRPGQMQASFTRRGGFDLWDYDADASWEVSDAGRPPVQRVVSILEDQGMDVEQPGVTSDVAARQDGVLVTVSWSTGAVGLVRIHVGSTEPVAEDRDLAGSTPPEDYTAYLRDGR